VLLLVGVIVAFGAALTPTRAAAFIGESSVLNPAKTDLTGPAKTILTNPTFLPDYGSGAAGAGATEAEATGFARLGMASGMLPWIGKVLPFVGGAITAYEICNAVITPGCGIFSKDSEDVPESGEWEWSYAIQGFTVNGSKSGSVVIPSFEWYASKYSSAFNPCEFAGRPAVPSQATLLGSVVNANCFHAGEEHPDPLAYAGVPDTRGRSFGSVGSDTGAPNYTGSGYCDSTGENCTSSPKSDWSERAATALKTGNYDKAGQYVASKIEGSEVASPWAKVTIPDCGAYLWGVCQEKLEKLGLEPTRVKLDWEGAVISKPADAVVETAPAGGAEVKQGSKVTVTTNPEESAMPLLVPQPESGETYSHYAARLNPSLSPTRHDLEAAFVDPATGPNGVVSVQPEPETRLDPGTEHEVKVTTNPADAPMPVGGWTPPGLPAIDLGPISGIPSPCTVFPFGLLCWFGEAIAQFNTTGVCPNFSAPVEGTESDFAVTLCGDTADTIMGYLRPAILLAFIVGLGFLFARATKAVGGD
jgi:hypothetical protein